MWALKEKHFSIKITRMVKQPLEYHSHCKGTIFFSNLYTYLQKNFKKNLMYLIQNTIHLYTFHPNKIVSYFKDTIKTEKSIF